MAALNPEQRAIAKCNTFSACIYVCCALVAWMAFLGHVPLALFLTLVGVALVHIREHVFPLEVRR